MTRSFETTAQQLRDGLVKSAGFNPIEAAQIVAPQQNLGFADSQAPYSSDPLPEEFAAKEVIVDAIADALGTTTCQSGSDTETARSP